MRTLSITLCSLLAVTACGDDSDIGGQPDASPTDAGVAPDAAAPTSTLFAVAGDFASGTGVASTISIPELEVSQDIIAGVASDDSVVRLRGDTLYIINRFGHDNITRIDAASLAFIDQISTGAGSNPQDVVAVGDKLYIAALNSAGVITIDGQGAMNVIDLASLDAIDGIPDCQSLALVGTSLVVTCGILDNFAPSGLGKVAIIDTTDDSVTGSFDLTTPNPFGLLYKTPDQSGLDGDLLIGTVDFGASFAGCIERIGVTPTIESKGCLLDNTELGGYATGLAQSEGTLTISVTSGFDAGGPVAQARSYDVVAGDLAVDPITGADERAFDVVVCPTGELVFADAGGGMRVYGADGVQLTSDVLDIGLPPVGAGMVCF